MDPREAEAGRNIDQNHSECTYYLAVDIGGSLTNLVYFTKNNDHSDYESEASGSCPVLRGRLNFKKFETSKIDDCLEFIKSMKLHLGGSQQQDGSERKITAIKATGGGAYKYADLFKERLGISLIKEDEKDCLVAGANFLLKVPGQEAFTCIDSQKQFVQMDHNDLFPYLLVNIGFGVGMYKVDGDGKFERVSGTSIGGGTFWGLGKLLTKCKSFDDLAALSYRGDNKAVDMLVGDIYGGIDYSKIGLSSSILASSFGKVMMSDDKELEDYKPEDMARSLLTLISSNIAQISCLNALLLGLKRILFAGIFIRSHQFALDSLSSAVYFWSGGEVKAMFLRHEGFLGAMGAFMSSDKHGLQELLVKQAEQPNPDNACCAVSKTQVPLDEKLNADQSIECTFYEA